MGPDSDAILDWFDKNIFDSDSAPFRASQDVNNQLYSNQLDAFGMYYTWINEKGFERSILAQMPWLLGGTGCFGRFLLDHVLGMAERRAEVKRHVRQMLLTTTLNGIGGFDSFSEADVDNILGNPDDDAELRKRYVKFLKDQQNKVIIEPNVQVLSQLPAAYFTLYVMLDRMVGNNSMGGKFKPSLPDLKEEEGLKPLFDWYARMENIVPIEFEST